VEIWVHDDERKRKRMVAEAPASANARSRGAVGDVTHGYDGEGL